MVPDARRPAQRASDESDFTRRNPPRLVGLCPFGARTARRPQRDDPALLDNRDASPARARARPRLSVRQPRRRHASEQRSAQDGRGRSSKLIFYGTLLENTVEFVREYAALQTRTQYNILSITEITQNCKCSQP